MKMPALNDQVTIQEALGRLKKYAETGRKMLRVGITTLTASEIASETSIEVEEVLGDLANQPDKMNQSTAFELEQLVLAIELLFTQGKEKKVIISGNHSAVERLFDSWEYQGFGFKPVLILSDDYHGMVPAGAELLRTNDSSLKDKGEHANVSGVIAADIEYAQKYAQSLVENGVSEIWNFSPLLVEVPEEVHVENVIPGYPKWPVGNMIALKN